MKLTAPVRLLVLLVGLAAWSGAALADCTNPASPEGGLDYDASAHEFKYCDNTNTWQSLGGGGAVSSLSDVNVTNVAGRDYLRYDAGSSKWVNISESTVMSTTTMVSNWPDAILCTGSSGSMVLYHSIDFSNGTYSYDRAAASDNRKTFTSAGAYSSGSDSGYSTDCINKSISQLYASGQAFNFIGNADTGGGALGDRITSGTLVVVANSATSYVSLSTGGTTWGYLSSGANYLPGLDIGNVGRILSANISAASSGKGLELRFISNTDRAYITSYDRGASAYKPLTTDSSYFSVNTAGAERLRIDASGNVGIGTTGPRAILDIVSSTSEAASTVNDGIGGLLRLSLGSAVTDESLFMGVNSGGYSWIQAVDPGNQYRNLALNSEGGNVGVGTSSPKAKLDVAGTISASDAVQVGSSSLTCSASIAGAMRYTSGTMQVCNGSSWGNVGIGVPNGTIAAFALSSCPSGWNEYTAARGRFLRGIDNGAGNDPAGTRAASSIQADAVQNASGTVGTQILDENDAGALADGVFNATKVANRAPQGGSGLSRNTIDFDLSRQIRTSTETRPKNVAVIFCQYAGFESSSSAGVATLASLSDVSIGGASNGQALVFNGASWVPSTTTGGGSSSAVSNTGAIQFSANGSGAFGGDASNLFWDNANKRLGIGTTSPAATLDVSGTAQIRHGANMWGGLYVSEQGVSNEGFHISHYGGSASGVVLSQEGSLPIRISVNGNEVARIHGNGNVGIGTTNPGHKLDIENTAGHSGIAINAGASSAAYIDFESNGTKVSNVFYDGANDVFKINSVGSKNTSINTNGGNVGIGTASPSQKLEVVGNVTASNYSAGGQAVFGDFWSNSPWYMSPYGYLGTNGSYRSSWMWNGYRNNGNTWTSMGVNGSAAAAGIEMGDAGVMFYAQSTTPTGSLPTERVRITNAGKVGIGTANPIALLTVGGVTSSGQFGVYGAIISGPDEATGALTASGSHGASLLLKDSLGLAGNGGALLFGANAGHDRFFAGIKGLLYDGNNYTAGHIAFSTRNANSDTTLTERMRITNDGKVGIGTTNPGSYKLNVAGTLYTSGGCTGCSDRRWKKNVAPIGSGLDLVEQLQGVRFDWRVKEFPDRQFPDTREIGFIAQDVEKVLPELVYEDGGYKFLRYDKMTAVLTEAVKELKAANDDLRAANAALVSRTVAAEAVAKAANDNYRNIEQRLERLEGKAGW